MQTVTTVQMLRKSVATLRDKVATVALVPTMGALHDGHIALMHEAASRADHVIASIFVNPTQFGPNEDLDTYPRQLEADSALLEEAGVTLLWAPDVAAMYPAGFATSMSVSGVGEGLCGADRPGHFDGVATVVCKLFNQVRPDIAIFGEKDWQQLAVIRRMARDLDLTLPVADKIIGMPTVREADGLARSSRNRYLSAADRQRATTLPRAMHEAIARIEAGEDVGVTLGGLEDELLGAGFASVDYAELADADSLALLAIKPTEPARLLVAARVGGTRLIDNMPVSVSRYETGEPPDPPI